MKPQAVGAPCECATGFPFNEPSPDCGRCGGSGTVRDSTRPSEAVFAPWPEHPSPMQLWHLSFATDDAFLGVVLVRAESFEAAHQRARLSGLNPGGSVVGVKVPPGFAVPEHAIGRRLQWDELTRLFGQPMTPEQLEALARRLSD